VAFSPDGMIVLTGSDKMARLWEAATGKEFGLPLQHQAGIESAAFSPDGKTVITGSDDKTARLWEVATGKQIGPTLQHQGPVNSVALSPDGKTVLTGSADNRARLWRGGDPQQILLWTQVITGLELDAAGNARVLDATSWHERRQRLQKLGGAPER
jgi:WD40 repeat protein